MSCVQLCDAPSNWTCSHLCCASANGLEKGFSVRLNGSEVSWSLHKQSDLQLLPDSISSGNGDAHTWALFRSVCLMLPTFCGQECSVSRLFLLAYYFNIFIVAVSLTAIVAVHCDLWQCLCCCDLSVNTCLQTSVIIQKSFLCDSTNVKDEDECIFSFMSDNIVQPIQSAVIKMFYTFPFSPNIQLYEVKHAWTFT